MENDYYVGWLSLALINSALAKAMGRDSGSWFLISIFLGPFATFFLIVTDSNGKDEVTSFSIKRIGKFFLGVAIFFVALFLISYFLKS
ncbi:MAG: hypothetical protein CL676_01460 [Bdellovibrionaceae bacterium]|nr:hypothetical protein [Pseudobdellovibrionaceae bacterium]|tara:strand:+ start:4603 stop:4866 length:264 start_codon:yes stop_codon:yes gene_type:complete